MRCPRHVVFVIAALLLPLSTTTAQQSKGTNTQPSAPKGPSTTTSQLGLPALPPLGNGLRRDTMRDADRIEVRPSPSQQKTFAVTGTSPVDAVLDKSYTGTGFHEHYTYQIPPDYEPDNAPVPMLIAYHGFGSSASNVSSQTLLDELCAQRGWFYLSVTGVDDQLFGTDIVQRNVDALLHYMLDQYSIDEDRLYMVGFSMGAGVTANYAATHLDPNDIMIAAVGLISGSFDWTMTYIKEPAVQDWMTNTYNFGKAPINDLFAYQKASGLYHDMNSYPPTTGILVPNRSLAWNLDRIPVWISWDVDDSLTYLPPQSESLVDFLEARGGEYASVPERDTVHPVTGLPATHSWAVMDPVLMFDFFEGREVNREPDNVHALLNESAAVSYLQATQVAANAFTEVTASINTNNRSIELTGGTNLAGALFNLNISSFGSNGSVEISATAAESHPLKLTIQDDSHLPGYLVNASNGQLALGAKWDPAGRSLSVNVPGFSSVHFLAEQGPWSTTLNMSPDPVAPGQDLDIWVHSPTGPATLWMILSSHEALIPVGPGVMLAVSPFPPALLHPLPLNAEGDLELTVTMPNDPTLLGTRLSFQGAVVPAVGWITDTTNPFSLDIQ